MATLKGESHGGIEINYEECGAGDPLVLIGGLTSTLEAWGLMVPERLASLTVGCSHAGGKTAVSPTDAVLQAMLAGSGEGASEETKAGRDGDTDPSRHARETRGPARLFRADQNRPSPQCRRRTPA
jgi:hypothetical protein